MKGYPEYKDSSIDWIDKVPAHWDIKRFKNLFAIKKDIAGTLGFDVLSITQRGVKIKDIESGSGQVASDYTKYQKVNAGDFAMNHMDLLTGFVDISKHDGVTSPDYRVFTLEEGAANKSYYLYLLQLCYTNKIFYPLGQGAAHVGRWRLPADAFKEFKVPFPPESEQVAITNHLDRETTRIDNLISEKQNFIKLLKEKRQALISHVVTKGLDPDVKMKDSGVEWIGEVPEHWHVIRLKYLCDLQTGTRNTEDAQPEGQHPFIVRSQKIKRINTFAADCEAVLTAGDGAGVGKIYHYINGKFDYHQRVYMMNNFRHISGKYFYHFLSEMFYKVALDGGSKSTVDSLRMPVFTNFWICIPPKEEQDKIMNFISNESSIIDDLYNEVSNSINLLQEHRTALISAAVTGKIDVRDQI